MSRAARKKLLPQDAPAEGEISTGPLDEKSARFPLLAPPVLENSGKPKNAENPRGYPMATQVKPLGHKGLRAPMPSKIDPLATEMATRRDLLACFPVDMPCLSLSTGQNLRGDNTLLMFHFSGVKTNEN